MRCFLATPPIRRRCGGFSNASSGNPPLVLVRPRPPSTDAGDHLKPADADHPLRFECRIEITHKSISQNCGDCGAPRRPSECAVTAPLTIGSDQPRQAIHMSGGYAEDRGYGADADHSLYREEC